MRLRILFDCTRCCSLDLSVPPKLEMSLLDSTVPYGCEYQGLSHHLVPTPMTDRAFVALSQVLVRGWSTKHHLTCLHTLECSAS